tara:strand:- start:23 stop:1198 length:1176 start_codon:yes stop_codon:yes gene_type:complete
MIFRRNKTSDKPNANIAFVGCGYVADYYAQSIKKHSELNLIGVFDKNIKKATNFGKFYNVPVYNKFQSLLNNKDIEIIVNLTNPDSHYTVSKACLEHGIHVYSEKPLTKNLEEAKRLVNIARRNGLLISSAPCSLFGKTAQTIKKALRGNSIGKVKLVYAELDEGPIHIENPDRWKSKSGNAFPYIDEFSNGCILELSSYHLSWLISFFGSVQRVTAFSSCLTPWKLGLHYSAADFSTACIKFQSGVIARLTNSTIAPYNHDLQIIGEKGVISIDECWNYNAPVYIRKFTKLSLQFEKYPFVRKSKVLKYLLGLNKKEYPLIKKPNSFLKLIRYNMDFSLGILNMVESIRKNKIPELDMEFSFHVNEVVLAIEESSQKNKTIKIKTKVSKQ